MDVLSWRDFDETAVPDFRPRPPHTELAEVLRRYRTDIDAAARSAADGRAHSLRALADQAVLALGIESLLAHNADLAGGRHGLTLRQLKDQMLAGIEEAGLEVVRLVGRTAEEVAGLVEIEHWRFEHSYERARVIEQLQPAVLLDGEPLRLGRVIMGAPPDHPVARPIELTLTEPRARSAAPPPPNVQPSHPADRARVVCPIDDCGVENELDAETCAGCLTQIGGYRRLSLYPEVLFNRGLRAARDGDAQLAREYFASVASWIPDDVRAWQAYALACVEAGDGAGARRAWQSVLELSPGDPAATRGLRAPDPS